MVPMVASSSADAPPQPPSPGALRSDFVVRDPAPDRSITFGDDVPPERIKDFFDRCGLAIDQLFNGGSGLRPRGLVFTQPLREAKDAVELPPGQAFLTCPDRRTALHVVQRFAALGMQVAEVATSGSDEARGALPVQVEACR